MPSIRRLEKAGPRQLVVRFALPTLVAFVLVGLVLHSVMFAADRRQKLAATETAAVAAAELLYHELLHSTPLEQPMAGSGWMPFSQLLPYHLSARQYLAASVWHADGTVLWASDRDLAGRRYGQRVAELEQVLASQRPVTRVMDAADAGPAIALDRPSVVVDVPVAPSGADGPQLVVRLVADYAPIAQEISATRRTLALTLAAALTGLFLLVLPFAAGAGRTLQQRAMRLRAAEQRSRALAEQSPDGILRLAMDRQAPCEYANPAMERLTGHPAGDWDDPVTLIRSHVPEPEAAEALIAGLSAPTSPDRSDVIDVPWTSADGTITWLTFHVAAVEPQTEDGATIIQAVVIDVSHRTRAQQQLEQTARREQEAAARLRELDEVKNAFLRAVSHELRTPLTSVVGASQTLLHHRNRLPESTTEQLIDSVARNAQRLQRLLSDLLDVDRLTSGVVQPQLQPADVAAIATRVLDGMDLSSHPVSTDLRPVTIPVHAPSIERIIENLVSNALKHTPPGTPVQVEVDEDASGATIIISDDGPGVPAELTETVFEPFVQGPPSREAANPGTGIGLALVERLTTLHGGSIRLESSQGGGSRFTVLLPAGAPDRSQGSRDRTRPPDDNGRRSVAPPPR